MNPDDASAKNKFQEVQAAYEVLSDPDKRKRYDQFGADFEQVGAGGGPRGWRYTTSHGPQTYPFDLDDLFGGGGANVEGGGNFSDLFRQFGRGRGGRREARPARGNDLKHELTVPFATAVLGGEAALTLRRQNGELETIRVKIPAGIDDGKKIRLRGQGEPGMSDAPPGDILLTIHVSPHPHFRRSGNRLDVRVPITLAEAALARKSTCQLRTARFRSPCRPIHRAANGCESKAMAYGQPTSPRATCLPRFKSYCPTD